MGVCSMIRKHVVPLLLVFILLLSLATACADESVKTDVITAEASTTLAESTELEPDLPDIDLEAETVNFLTEENPGYDWYTSKEIYAETQNGELFNDAVYSRNLLIEERFNVKITQSRLQNATNVARKSLTAGETEYDVIMPYMNIAISLPQEGLLLELNKVPYLELDNPWWDQRANENLKMNGKLFFTTGDISILDNECTMVMFFNKKLIGDYSLDNPYELVKSNKWTLDKLYEMSVGVTNDIDGDGKLTQKDLWGLTCAGNAPHSFFFASGERIASNNSEGQLELVMNTTRAANVIDKIMSVCLDPLVLSDHTGGSGFDQVCVMFNDSRVLFVTFALVDINGLRDAEFEFGILPYPLYDESQSEYNCLISSGIVPALSVPYNCTKLDAVGIVLESMAYYSVDTLTAAYYDNALKTRYIRDEESGDMLDIIFATRVYDLGFIFDWGGAGNLIYNMYMKKNNNFASAFTAIEEKAITAMNKTIEAFNSIS